MNIDEWYAEQVGAKRMKNGGWISHEYQKASDRAFSISEPACREIVREKFALNTDIALDGRWYCHQSKNLAYKLTFQVSYGKTIAEAEIACLTAIYEARDED